MLIEYCVVFHIDGYIINYVMFLIEHNYSKIVILQSDLICDKLNLLFLTSSS